MEVWERRWSKSGCHGWSILPSDVLLWLLRTLSDINIAWCVRHSDCFHTWCHDRSIQERVIPSVLSSVLFVWRVGFVQQTVLGRLRCVFTIHTHNTVDHLYVNCSTKEGKGWALCAPAGSINGLFCFYHTWKPSPASHGQDHNKMTDPSQWLLHLHSAN